MYYFEPFLTVELNWFDIFSAQIGRSLKTAYEKIRVGKIIELGYYYQLDSQGVFR